MLLILFLSLIFTSVVFSKNAFLEQDYYEIDKTSTIFDQFIEKYEKKYSPTEYSYRLSVFKETLVNINKWNEENPGMYGVNEFSDLTFEEFSKKYMGFNGDVDITSSDVYQRDKMNEAPKYLDWRDFGYVTQVKNQQMCGSCYAFSAVGHIEGLYAKKHNTTAINLSEQQVLDCDTSDAGCFGGMPDNVFKSLISQGGLMREDDYSYEATQGDCMLEKSKVVVNVTGGKYFMDMEEVDLKDAVANQGPISIGMLFTRKMISIKTGKVYKPTEDCNANHINHAVLIVGYGRDNDDDYWIIKNSWGTHWGDRGYMRIVRGVKACHVGSYVAVAEVQ